MRYRSSITKNLAIILAFIVLTIPFLNCSTESPTETNKPAQEDLTLNVPAEYPTIQEAVNAFATGKEIILADGIYSGPGNTDIILQQPIKIRSENGPAHTVIDCQGDASKLSRAFLIEGQSTSNSIFEGITIRNGFNTSGGAIYFKSSSPVIKNCVFENNTSTVSGGAVRCKSASPKFVNCTFVGNSAPNGGAIFAIASSSPVLENCIIAFSDSGQSVFVADVSSKPLLNCCNVIGNEGGDWPSSISSQSSSNGNFSLQPVFCDTANSDYSLQSNSPCAPSMNSCGVLIGALPVNCP